MADVGRSTAAHGESLSEERRQIRLQLVNWGNWLKSLSLPHAMRRLPPSPAFREGLTRYADDEKPLPVGAFDTEAAERFDQFIASNVSQRLWQCLVLRYMKAMPSREAAMMMTRYGHPCSHVTVIAWTDSAEEALELALQNTSGDLQDRVR